MTTLAQRSSPDEARGGRERARVADPGGRRARGDVPDEGRVLAAPAALVVRGRRGRGAAAPVPASRGAGRAASHTLRRRRSGAPRRCGREEARPSLLARRDGAFPPPRGGGRGREGECMWRDEALTLPGGPGPRAPRPRRSRTPRLRQDGCRDAAARTLGWVSGPTCAIETCGTRAWSPAHLA